MQTEKHWGHDTNSATPENLFRVPIRKIMIGKPENLYHVPRQVGKALLLLLVALVMLAGFSTAAWAVPELRRIDTKNVTKFEEPEAVGDAEVKGGHEGEAERDKHDSLSEKKALGEGEAEEEGHEGEGEHVPVWMFPGWQTVFAILGVGYYALMLTYLPKLMAKEEGHH